MNTDPLCPQQHTHPKHNPSRCFYCEYGAAVREDERGKNLSTTTAVNPRDGGDWNERGPGSEEHGAHSRKERQYRLILDTNTEYDDGYAKGRADERAKIVAYLRDELQHPSVEAGAWANGFAEVIETGAYNGAARGGTE